MGVFEVDCGAFLFFTFWSACPTQTKAQPPPGPTPGFCFLSSSIIAGLSSAINLGGLGWVELEGEAGEGHVEAGRDGGASSLHPTLRKGREGWGTQAFGVGGIKGGAPGRRKLGLRLRLGWAGPSALGAGLRVSGRSLAASSRLAAGIYGAGGPGGWAWRRARPQE